MNVNTEDAIRHLDEALDHLLALRGALGLGDVPEPSFEALDLAVGQDDEAKTARVEIRRALRFLLEAVETEAQRAAVFRLEENYNARISIGMNIGFRLGWTAARGGR